MQEWTVVKRDGSEGKMEITDEESVILCFITFLGEIGSDKRAAAIFSMAILNSIKSHEENPEFSSAVPGQVPRTEGPTNVETINCALAWFDAFHGNQLPMVTKLMDRIADFQCDIEVKAEEFDSIEAFLAREPEKAE